ncbi:MAG: hypothetical protein AAGB34_06670, partial [Planctomycetota bacterium]
MSLRLNCSPRFFAISATWLSLAAVFSIQSQVPLPGYRPPDSAKSGDNLVELTAISDHESVIPGSTVHIAARFEIEPDWHTYWHHSGDSGGPPVFD